MNAEAIRAAFRRQAKSCGQLGSPFTERLLGLLAERLSIERAVGHTLLNWPGDPGADALALRMAGALHAQVLTGQSPDLAAIYPPNPRIADEAFWTIVDSTLDRHEAAIGHFIQSPPQTNEVARSAALAAGFLAIAAKASHPLAILEIGASAGLNLNWDAYGYDLGGLDLWQATGQPILRPAWRGPQPPMADIQVCGRKGCDRSPIDIGAAENILRLRAYIWPDQADRLTRLDQAIAAARSSSLPIDRADAADWTERELATPRPELTTVLFHSIVWQYLDKDKQQRLSHIIEEAGRRADDKAPFAWLRMEPETADFAALRLTLWPGGKPLYLADVDYHGRWVTWHGDPGPERREYG